jgi:hypothetical protein
VSLATSVTLAKFVAALFPEAAGHVEFRAVRPGAGSVGRYFLALDDIERGLTLTQRFLERHAAEELFFGVASRKTTESGDLGNCQHLSALYTDIDFKITPEAQARQSLGAFQLPPSVVVLSGGGLHGYWLLRESVDLGEDGSATRAKGLLRRLALHLGGDLAAAEPARVLRVPGARNHKYTPARTVTLEVFEPSRRYNPSEFEWLLPPEPTPNGAKSPSFTMPPTIEDGHRNDTLYKSGRSLRAKGWSESAISAALKAENAERCQPPLDADEMDAIISQVLNQADRPKPPTDVPRNGDERRSPWDAAQPVAEFLSRSDDEVHYLDPLDSLVRGALTEWFSPRGLGKTLLLHLLLVALALGGLRILLLDRDNPAREVRRRLRAAGAGALVDSGRFHIMTRDETPPLTDRVAWAQFPFDAYDVAALDSLDASTEGVGEQDSAKPARALAALLDVAHSANGPAVIVLGNTTKSGMAGRGSGVVEDRADIVYEVRDATDFTPTGKVAWWEELPPAARIDWASRATRRKRRDTYRLAIIATKHRVGAEPEPRVVEICLTETPWTWRDVTAELVAAGEQAREDAARDVAERLDRAAVSLVAEIERRDAAKADALTKREAEGLLQAAGLKRAAARGLVTDRDGQAWMLGPDPADARAVLVTRISRGTTATCADLADSHKQRGFFTSDAADRMNTGRPHLSPENARDTADGNAAESDSPRVGAGVEEARL